MKTELLLLDFKNNVVTKLIGSQRIGLPVKLSDVPNLNKDGVEDLRTISMLDERNPFKP